MKKKIIVQFLANKMLKDKIKKKDIIKKSQKKTQPEPT